MAFSLEAFQKLSPAEQAVVLASLQKKRDLKMKVSDKGALSIYGMGRFPVTLYKSQWNRLLDIVEDIRAFIKANDKALKDKDD